MIEHEIKTIEDISKIITLENLDDFIKDFNGILIGFLAVKSINPNTEFKDFTWIEDGKHEIKIEIHEKTRRRISKETRQSKASFNHD